MARVKINLDSTEQILLKRSLNKNGAGQQFFTSEVARLSDPYIPMDTGNLKNNRIIGTDKITYTSIYARRQYYENKGKGLRGKQWSKRMWADRGKEIVQAVARFCGVRSK